MVRGAKIYLRPFTRDDLPLFERWSNDLDHNSEYNTFGLTPAGSLEAGFAQSGLLDARQGMLVVAIVDDDRN